MSVYKSPKSAHYQYDFQYKNHRFFGSTGATSRREAEAVERRKKDEARAEIGRLVDPTTAPLTMDIAAARYWREVGQHHAAPNTTWKNLERLIDFFGAEKRLVDITSDAVADLVARRRGETIKGRKAAARIAPATVNRSTIEPLQKIFTRAKREWGATFPHEPDWRRHRLKEPEERVREVREVEESALDDSIRPDYRAFVAFARASGLRLAECLLTKDKIHLAEGYLATIGKGGKMVRRPITGEMRAILAVELQNPTEWVFTYRAARAKKGPGGYPRGAALPITASGLKTLWRRARSKRGAKLPADLHFHDLRHDFATKLLRATGNLKLVQKSLGHADISTTTKYAHVHDDEILAGMEKASKLRLKARTKRKNAP